MCAIINYIGPEPKRRVLWTIMFLVERWFYCGRIMKFAASAR
jgi:hypothetical protein